jgi:hypothetical protein
VRRWLCEDVDIDHRMYIEDERARLVMSRSFERSGAWRMLSCVPFSAIAEEDIKRLKLCELGHRAFIPV